MIGKNYNSTLRFNDHRSHRDILLEFYVLNKYLITEQLKDTLLDAVECMDYVIQQTGYSGNCETCKHHPDCKFKGGCMYDEFYEPKENE